MIKNIVTVLFTILALNGCVSSDNNREPDSSIFDYFKSLDKEEFEQTIFECNNQFNYKGNLPAVIVIYNKLSKDCARELATLKEIHSDYNGKILFFTIDDDNQKEIASQFSPSTYPTTVFVPLNNQIQTVGGLLDKSQFEKAFKEIFNVE